MLGLLLNNGICQKNWNSSYISGDKGANWLMTDKSSSAQCDKLWHYWKSLWSSVKRGAAGPGVSSHIVIWYSVIIKILIIAALMKNPAQSAETFFTVYDLIANLNNIWIMIYLIRNIWLLFKSNHMRFPTLFILTYKTAHHGCSSAISQCNRLLPNNTKTLDMFLFMDKICPSTTDICCGNWLKWWHFGLLVLPFSPTVMGMLTSR